MKKIFYLLVIFNFLSVKAQIELTPIIECSNEFIYINLTDLEDEIISLEGGNNEDYTITYHNYFNEAQNGTNTISTATNYQLTSTHKTIFIRIHNNLDDSFTIYSILLGLNLQPAIPEANLFNSDGEFDLTVNDSLILYGTSGVLITYHETFQDAQNNANYILNPENYIISNHKTVFARVETSNGCSMITSFQLIKNDTDFIINIPDTNFKTHLVQFLPWGGAYDYNNNFIITDLNEDGEIQLSEAMNISRLGVYSSNISNLTGIEAFLNLNTLSCSNNNLSTVDFSNNIHLTFLSCDGNDLTELDLSSNVNLTQLICKNNDLTTLDLSNNTQLIKLDCSNNNLMGVIDLTNNTSLTSLNYNNNLLYLGIGTSNMPNLTELYCSSNNIYTLDISNNLNLTTLNCNNNNITELDLSNNSNLKTLWAIYNPLTHLNIKNGGNLDPTLVDSGSWTEMWMNLPDNIYICADDDEVSLIQPHLNTWNTGQIVASYCSFNPEGDYNTITGSVFYDFNNNGCDENDVVQYTKININDGTENGVSYTNQNGNYIFFTQDGTFVLTPELENPTFFNVTPVTETVVFSDNNNNEEIVNFCITPNSVHNDLEVVIAPINPARPGFEATYNIVYRNKGNQILSEDYGLSFFFNQQLMSFVSASVEPDSQVTGGLNWSYENLMPFESRSIIVTMQINPPTHPTYPVNIDDVLTFTSVIMPQNGDENVQDNTYIFDQTVVGAYDPNDITCIEGDIVDPEYIGEELHYVIRFENTGNFYAENVVIAMEVNEELYDVSSLRVLNASHDVRAQVRDNVAEFFFNQIMLDSGGHGNILLVMKSYTALEEGDSVMSKADIYFDYNYPIITNDAVTVFETTMSIDDNTQNIDLKVYPNPTTDYFNLMSEAKIQSVELYDISGRLIKTSLINNFETKQDIMPLNKGTYILKIKTENGEITGKIIKN